MIRPRPHKASGFTLVELMVVLVIIGLAATAVMLAIPEQGGSIQAEAERFAARAKAAHDNAVVESRPAAIVVGPAGYSISRRVAGEWQEQARYEWAPGTRIAVAGEGRTRFDPTGLAEPLRLQLDRGETRVAVEIGHDGSIQIVR
jgi:general secretion pathway protein H